MERERIQEGNWRGLGGRTEREGKRICRKREKILENGTIQFMPSSVTIRVFIY